MTSTFRQTNAFAMQNGLLFSLWWIIGFILMINSMEYPFLQNILLANFLLAPIIGGAITSYFIKQIGSKTLSFNKAFTHSLLIYFYAAIILALISYIYFSYLDNGYFLDSYQTYLQSNKIQDIINTPEYQQIFQNSFQTTDLNVIIDRLRDISPIEIAASIINMNFFLGLFFSFPTAFFCKQS